MHMLFIHKTGEVTADRKDFRYNNYIFHSARHKPS